MENIIHVEYPYENIDIPIYNKILTDSLFWNRINSDFALVFQTDTFIFRPIDECYFNYDYIGAPWLYITIPSKNNSKVGNGGFSLRRVDSMIDICDTFTFVLEKDDAEDIFFAKNCKNLAPYEDAKTFSVESIFYETPCGAHQCWKWLPDKQLIKLLKNLK